MNFPNPRLEGIELLDQDDQVLLMRAVFGPQPRFSDENRARGARYILGQLAVNELGLAFSDETVTRCYQWPDCPVCGGV